jgi:hypothetical protein
MTNGQKGIWAAVIAAVGGIIVALIAHYSPGNNNNGNDHPGPQDVQYTGRVIDKQTQQTIQGALVSVDTQGPPQTYHTDSNGIFYTRLSSDTKSVHIRVEADGYKIFDSNVAPASRTGLEDIRLERSQGSVSVGLVKGLSLQGAIKFVAEQGKSGVQYVGNCNPRFMQMRVEEGEYRGKDWGDIIERLQYRLVDAKTKSGYRVSKIKDGVYQVECTN